MTQEPKMKIPIEVLKERRNEALPRIGRWIVEGDTGLSSLSLCAIYLDADKYGEIEISAPLDPSDFNRCILFLEKINAEEVWPLLQRMAKIDENWARLVKNWDNLLFLYNQEKGQRNAPKLYELMKQLYKPKGNEIIL